MRRLLSIALLGILTLGVGLPADAQMTPPPGLTMMQDAGAYRIELVLLPAEPFYTQQQVDAQHVTSGMLVVGGATPVPPGAATHPNHHLVVHVFDRASGAALRGAHITITYAPAGNDAASAEVQIVEMQAIGKGPESTHYGNNVTLAPGTYHVTVTVNGKTSTTFTINA